MSRKKRQKGPEPEMEQDEDLAPEPEKSEKPKGPNGRLLRSQKWATRSENLMKDVEADVGNATMELIGPGARDALLRYNGGSKLAAAGEVEEAKSKAIAIAKAAKEVAKHAKAAADQAEFLAQAIDVAYIDLLTGQTSIDDCEDGRNRDSKKKPAEPAGAPEAPAAEAGAAPRVGRVPAEVPGIDPAILARTGSVPGFRELGEAVARDDRGTGVQVTDLEGYLRVSVDMLADVREGAPALELTDEERAEFRAGQLLGLGVEERPAVTIEGPPDELLKRARTMGADHKRLTMSECTRAEALAELLGPEAQALEPAFQATLLVSYSNGYNNVPPAPAVVADQAAPPQPPPEAPKQRGRRGGRSR